MNESKVCTKFVANNFPPRKLCWRKVDKFSLEENKLKNINEIGKEQVTAQRYGVWGPGSGVPQKNGLEIKCGIWLPRFASSRGFCLLVGM